MLAIKDGGVNDTDGEQADNTGDANGVVASTISIANPAFQVLLSVQIVLVLEWVVLLISTSKSAQPVTNEYLRNSAFAGIAPMANKPTTLAMPTVWLQALFQSQCQILKILRLLLAAAVVVFTILMHRLDLIWALFC
jgi:hypothetical protein